MANPFKTIRFIIKNKNQNKNNNNNNNKDNMGKEGCEAL